MIVKSRRWVSKPKTFIVREEADFTVTCTVIQPVAKARNKMPIFKRIGKSPSEHNLTDKSGVVIERDVFDDADKVAASQSASNGDPRKMRKSWRNSGWAGVFAGSGTDASDSSEESSVEGALFAIDQRNNHLLVAEVDVGVKRMVHKKVEAYKRASKDGGNSGWSSCGEVSMTRIPPGRRQAI